MGCCTARAYGEVGLAYPVWCQSTPCKRSRKSRCVYVGCVAVWVQWQRGFCSGGERQVSANRFFHFCLVHAVVHWRPCCRPLEACTGVCACSSRLVRPPCVPCMQSTYTGNANEEPCLKMRQPVSSVVVLVQPWHTTASAAGVGEQQLLVAAGGCCWLQPGAANIRQTPAQAWRSTVELRAHRPGLHLVAGNTSGFAILSCQGFQDLRGLVPVLPALAREAFRAAANSHPCVHQQQHHRPSNFSF